MWWRTLVPLVVATGCNWVYGLDQTILIDAQNVETLPSSRTSLTWAIPTTDSMGNRKLEYPPFGSEMMRKDVPTILVGDDTKLEPASYDPDGTFVIPYDLREAPHRIVYTLPGESVSHEVQWSIGGAYLVVPRTTRIDARPPPAGSGYAITPTGFNGQVVAPALYTSGAFTFSNDGNDFVQTNQTITFPFATDATPVTAPLGTPEPMLGDWVLLAEFASNGTYSFVTGYAKTQITLTGAMSAPATEPAWMTSPSRTLSTIKCGDMPPVDCLPAPNATQNQMRLMSIVGGSTFPRQLLYGVSPSADLAGFLPGRAPLFVDRPLLLPFADAPSFPGSITLVDPSSELGLERVVAARISTSRTVSGAMLTSSLQVITNGLNTSTLQFGAPLITSARLGMVSLETDAAPVPASSGLHRLQFTPEGGVDYDDFVVTLFELTGGALAPVRYFHVIAPEVKVDSTLLVAGREYVFAITARTGFPSADRGDYRDAAYPFSSSTTFTRTFVVQ